MRTGHSHIMRAWWKRLATQPHGWTILYLGDHAVLEKIIGAAFSRGFGAVEIPHPALICAVADHDVLSGRGCRADTSQLRRVRELNIPCLDPEQALAWLAELDKTDHLASA
ncbi:hypothetical protein [Amycolatopsis thailandensis]|uniref:hypothetical protein n=1 Tax=Amycolatopsis thailandensis TaxID=589330 RepID=UPI003633E50D